MIFQDIHAIILFDILTFIIVWELIFYYSVPLEQFNHFAHVSSNISTKLVKYLKKKPTFKVT